MVRNISYISFIVLSFLMLSVTSSFAYSRYDDPYPDLCLGVKAGWSDYALTASAKKSYFFGLVEASVDVYANMYELLTGVFLDAKYFRIDLNYGRFYKMDLSYKIDAVFNKYESSYSFPGFGADEYSVTLKAIYPLNAFRMGLGLTGSMIRMSPFDVLCEKSTNQYDYIVYDSLGSERTQKYIAENLLYDVFVDVFFGYCFPIGGNCGVMINLDLGLDFIAPYLLDKEAQRNGIKDQVDSLGIGAFKTAISVDFYFRIDGKENRLY